MPSPSLSGSGQPSSSWKPSLSSASVGHLSASSGMPSPSGVLRRLDRPSRRSCGRTPCRWRAGLRSRPSRRCPTRSAGTGCDRRRGGPSRCRRGTSRRCPRRARVGVLRDHVLVVRVDTTCIAPPPNRTNGISLLFGSAAPNCAIEVRAVRDVPDIEHQRARLARDDTELALDSEDVVEHHAEAKSEQCGVALGRRVRDVGHTKLVVVLKTWIPAVPPISTFALATEAVAARPPTASAATMVGRSRRFIRSLPRVGLHAFNAVPR